MLLINVFLYTRGPSSVVEFVDAVRGLGSITWSLLHKGVQSQLFKHKVGESGGQTAILRHSKLLLHVLL